MTYMHAIARNLDGVELQAGTEVSTLRKTVRPAVLGSIPRAAGAYRFL